MQNTDSGSDTVTFIGNVLQGTATAAVPNSGFVVVASMIPLAGQLDTSLSLPISNGDAIYKVIPGSNPTAYTKYAYSGGVWSPTAPTANVGEAFWVDKAAAPWTWSQTLTLPCP